MSGQPAFTDYVIPQLLSWRHDGLGSALITLVGVEGNSPRPVGSQLAVNERGDYVGEISSGCADAAIVAEALLAIAEGCSRTVRYGARSKYIDVVLPCGSGIDVHFDPGVSTSTLRDIDVARSARRSVGLRLSGDDIGPSEICAASGVSAIAGLVRLYQPPIRLLICGRGASVRYLAQFGHQIGLEVVVYSQDPATLAGAAPWASQTIALKGPADFSSGLIDPQTAVVTLFHDHDWELPVFLACARQPPLYMGALGSRRAHEARKTALREAGCSRAFVEAIRGPVGLDIGAQSPPEIALSIAAELLSLKRGALLVGFNQPA